MAIVLQAVIMSFTLLATSQASVNNNQEDHVINGRSAANVSLFLEDDGLHIVSREEHHHHLRQKVRDLVKELASVKSTLQKRVAFSAHFADVSTTINVQASEPFKFNVVVTNIGNGYNPNSGIFTAPYSGVYLFVVTVMMDDKHSWFHAVIDKSGEILCRAALNEAWLDRFDKSTCSSTTYMKAGDRVYVRRLIGGDTYIRGGPYCSFTGVLISADIV